MELITYKNGKPIGKTNIFKENGKVYCEFYCPYEENKIVRHFLKNTKGENVQLGVMLHESGRFVMRKTLSPSQWGKDGEKAESAYIEVRILGKHNTPPLPFFFEEFTPLIEPLATADHALQNCTQSPSGKILYHKYGDFGYLAVPLCHDKPFDLAAFFCLITPVTYEDNTYGIISLDQENNPCFLNKEED